MASTAAGRLRRRGREPEEGSSVEPYRVTPKLARRFAILGALVLIGFAALVMRLWTLQVLAGSTYAARANANQTREVPVPAARGAIVDRNGDPLVSSAPVTAVDLYLSGLPASAPQRFRELTLLSRATHVPLGVIRRGIRQRKKAGDMITPVVVRPSAPPLLITYLQERAGQFPGVSLTQTYIRKYPHGTLAAQLFGVVGAPTLDQLKSMPTLQLSDQTGRSGIEYAFNRYLQGTDGIARLRVDSFDRVRSRLTLVKPSAPGNTVRLTIDTRLQQAAQNALTYGIQLAQSEGNVNADGGAIVAMNPFTGAILAAASAPTYDPSVYTGRVTNRRLAAAGLLDSTALAHNYPGIDRALNSTYPPGSTFKPLTAIAALQEGVLHNPYAYLQCTGSYTAPEDLSHHPFNNWDPNINQGMDLPTALGYSCDTYFYQLGNRFFLLPPDRGQPEQAWARKFGFGEPSPLEVPDAAGLVPTIAWKRSFFNKSTDSNWRIDQLWKPGDSINLSIGQGYLLVTPLQMTRFYAAIANGGRLVSPHLLLDVENPNKTLVATTAPAAPKPIPGLSKSTLNVVQAGLFEATHATFGTSYPVFGNFPIPIAGKTGTAEKFVTLPSGYQRWENQSWWCGYGPIKNPKLVVCAMIENGGEGGAAAAPAAERVFAKFFGVQYTVIGPIHSD